MAEKSYIRVDAGRELFPMGDMYGIFFEDINHAADGGLYAEMVQNRSFEFCALDNPEYTGMTAWETVERDGGVINGRVESEYPMNVKNTHYYRFSNARPSGAVGLKNLGFNTGIPLKKGEDYVFSMFARRDVGLREPVEVRLESAGGELYGMTTLRVANPEWTKYTVRIKSSAEDFSARLVILMYGRGCLAVDMVSLFPTKTFMGRENGLRPDIAKYLEDMKPSFMRFPGGCLTHAGALDPNARDSLYRWKNTIGPLEERPSKANMWRYNQTYGFGYYEFFCFCEDIGTKPLPVLPGAYNPHRRDAVPMDEIQPWLDDALELIEFATGAPDTKWGAVRAKMGHPAPFELEYLAIGNEETDVEFFERYPLFHKAISEKYPSIKLLNTAGPFFAGSGFKEGWESARTYGSWGVDEHYYVAPEWLLAHYDRYADDFYDANGPKVFLGEYASWGNTHYNALCEAAYMTSFELNADVVGLTCYAPLFCNADYANWRPDLIWYNNHEVYGIPSYYTQKLFSVNKGDTTLAIDTHISEADASATVPKRFHGRMGIKCQIEGSFADIRLNGKTVEGFDIRRGEWQKSAGQLSHANEEPVMGFRRPPANADVSFGGDMEDFVCEFKLKANAHFDRATMYEGGRPRYRRGLSLIICEDGEENFTWMLGGFNNDESRISRMTGSVENRLDTAFFALDDDREFDICIKKTGGKLVCSVDGKVLHDVTYDPQARYIYASATVDHAAGEVIIKAVNVRETPARVALNVENAGDGAREVSLECMTGEYKDTNDFDQPYRVAPTTTTFKVDGPAFEYEFTPRSLNILRFPIKTTDK